MNYKKQKPTTVPIKYSIASALKFHQTGKIDKAEVIYKKILKFEPNNADTLHLMGLIYLTKERHTLAIKSIQRAVSVKKSNEIYRHNLGLAYGGALDWQHAIKAFKAAIEIKPDFIDSLYNLAYAYEQTGNIDDAFIYYRKVLDKVPQHENAINNLSLLLIKKALIAEAILLLKDSIQQNPAFTQATFNLGVAYLNNNDSQLAINCFETFLKQEPQRAEGWYNLANSQLIKSQHKNAIVNFQKAIELKPQYIDAHLNLGMALLQTGKKNEAINAFEQVLFWNKNSSAALFNLSLIPKAHESKLISRIENLLENKTIENKEKMDLYFALGMLYESEQDYSTAFEYFQWANKLKQADYDPKREEQRVDRLIKVFNQSFFKAFQHNRKEKKELPIFIVGMPRSGTSLVEQILASHPQVYGAGELIELNNITTNLSELLISSQPYPECISELGKKTIEQIRNQYLDFIKSLAPNNILHITDKLPGNFFNIGLITLLFPAARIIHCLRSPLDTCLSCYTTNFTGHLPFSYDLINLGHQYQLYLRLMQHWKIVLPTPVFELSYEQLVANPELQSRALIEFCGLEWHSSCLEFYKTDRAVKTASAEQVRHPINTKSIGRWKNYGNQLQQLRNAISKPL